MESIEIANKTQEMAKRIFGEKTFITNTTMLTYAMTMTKVPSMEADSRIWFDKAEKLFTVINNEISFKEGCNLLFNMLFHYNSMLNDFGSKFDSKKRTNLVQKLREQVEVGNHNVLMKKVLVSIQ